MMRSMWRNSCDILTFLPFKLEANYGMSHNLFKPSFPQEIINKSMWGQN
jgi:hypothetical protein